MNVKLPRYFLVGTLAVLNLLFVAVAAQPEAPPIETISDGQPQSEQPAEDDPGAEISRLKEEINKLIQSNETRKMTLTKELTSFAEYNKSLKAENENLKTENGQLKSDNQSLAKSEETFKLEKDTLKTALANQKNLYSKQKEILKLLTRERLRNLRKVNERDAYIKELKETLRNLNREYDYLKIENKNLRHGLVPSGLLKKELAIVYQQLGTAYTQTRNFDLAMDVYKKSLKYWSRNSAVHRDLGLLYYHSQNEPNWAAYHLTRYLELTPNARDRREIKYLIRRLHELGQPDPVLDHMGFEIEKE